MVIFIAILSGALMSIQGVFNTELTKSTSLWVTNMWVQITAFIVCLLAWLFTGREKVSGLFSLEHPYVLLGGAIGAFITLTVIKSMDGLGPANAVVLIVTSQTAVAYLIQVLGLFGVERVSFQIAKVVGLALCIVGIFIFQR